MYSVYKNLTAQDIGIVPFNAHKQYDFTSASAASNQIAHFNTRWTSESIYLYSSGAMGGSASADTINTIKYNQLDHLYYRNFKRDINTKLGNVHYLNQKRTLYKEANILSIPTGLYGHQIFENTFHVSSSAYEITDDSNGNLIISGTNIDNYETDIRSNVFSLGPIDGFKKYDLNTIKDFVADGIYHRPGQLRVNQVSTHTENEFDDSYFFNVIRYTDATFEEKTLPTGGSFPTIIFDGANTDIQVGNDEKFHFNKGDDFTISFWLKRFGIGDMTIGSTFTIPNHPNTTITNEL